MNNSRIITLTVASIVAFIIMQLIIQFIIRRSKSKTTDEGKFKTSYGIYFSSLFIASSIAVSKSIIILTEAIDNIYKLNAANSFVESAKVSCLFIGVTALWFVIWHLIIKVMIFPITGKRKTEKEMESNNYMYFLIKGVLLICFIWCLSPVFEMLLRLFMPTIQIPFYH